MQPCVHWRDQADGCHGDCAHPDGHGEPCILNDGDTCVLRVRPTITIEVYRDDVERLRRFGYPVRLALSKVLDLAE